MEKIKSPIEDIQWLDPNTLTANDYNPNFVFTKEMRLLEFSLKRQGWIQPILINKDLVIIDGFHRHTIAKKNNWLVPCAVLDIDDVERRLLTVRINRAKGSHIAVRMSDLIQGLLADGVSRERIAEEIGGDLAEVDLLSKKDVFEKFNLEGHEYSRSWIPKKKAQAKKPKKAA
jgi:ParB-like chromosome segregation protein Spo0J